MDGTTAPAGQRSILVGKPDHRFTNNAVHTGKYNLWNFLPIAIGEQFRRNGNLYFLVMGCLMFIGTYTALFDSSVSPWTTLGPLAVVMSVSLAQEGAADLKRHRSDKETNNHPCIVVRRSEDLENIDGKGTKAEREMSIMKGEDVVVKLLRDLRQRGKPKIDSANSFSEQSNASFDSVESGQLSPGNSSTSNRVNICFQKIRRQDIRAGDVVLVRNREMIPADIILLGSSGDEGSSYIETSPIDGETNLKLRQSPRLPEGSIMMSSPKFSFSGSSDMESMKGSYAHPKQESIEQAVKRITRISLLGYPNGVSALRNKYNRREDQVTDETDPTLSRKNSFFRSFSISKSRSNMIRSKSNESQVEEKGSDSFTTFIGTLTSEPPNASVNTFSGKITLPPTMNDSPSIPIALGAENILLRGAVLRNTEWALGVACFTGSDTKLVRNSIATPSKFSRLDVLMNRTVILILFIMMTCVLILSILAYVTQSSDIDELWYAGYSTDDGKNWPYLPDLEIPEWSTNTPYVVQFIFTYVTLLNNFVPLSLYVTVEVITLFMMFLITWDKNMYHKETDTPAMARSTNVTDLGQVKYIFSDKTGTLTQNVMGFKRCSVDGMIFGAPVEKTSSNDSPNLNEDEEDERKKNFVAQPFHPLRHLLVGTVSVPVEKQNEGVLTLDAGLDAMCGTTQLASSHVLNEKEKSTLTFNAEMFLRVMSLCHTVVVEKEIDASTIDADEKDDNSKRSSSSSGRKPLRLFRRKNTSASSNRSHNSGKSVKVGESTTLGTLHESESVDGTNGSLKEEPSNIEKVKMEDIANDKGLDGSPVGFAYQAESPDEGALVSAASSIYGFQLRARDSNGIQIYSSSPSLLSDSNISHALKSNKITAKQLAAETATPKRNDRFPSSVSRLVSGMKATQQSSSEVWTLLAVNKFDSDRKRMSVLVRSPPELGSIPMLLCKGADSSMLDPAVCEEPHEDSSILKSFQSKNSSDYSDGNGEAESKTGSDWDTSVKLGIQAHLGAFASEGLRTLVLGMRILSEEECQDWLESYDIASTAMTNRNFLLTEVAKDIETKLHIVGATAIEDKLQEGVPDTIQNIGHAGIKLWVLTGDKRETAIEIGYSTKVLNPKMHVTDVADGPVLKVKALVAMEFLRLVKMGKLKQYQRSTTSESKRTCFLRRFSRSIREEEEREDPSNRHRIVRDLAEKIIKEYLESPEGILEKEKYTSNKRSMLEDDDVPEVFKSASNARASLSKRSIEYEEGSIRNLALASITSDEIAASESVVEEDLLSIQSFVPGQSEATSSFNEKKRTLLEKLFAVDRDVRKGQLVKHLVKEKRQELKSSFNLLQQRSPRDSDVVMERDRGLVIEGSALSHFLGDPIREELLFSVASNCESVIACRVSPKQKALLVNLVRQFIVPSPVTLAIGDGANDVGMIQEAEVGVGISGLEGQQAVNASDFSIAQFRFLEDLLLVHGRWNFMRMSKVVLFSFYKNSVLAALLILYSSYTFYSGTPLFDMWALSAFNFVCGFPILFNGFFDQDIGREYVKKHPQLYASGANNEYLSLRVTLRWVVLVIFHSNIIFYLSLAGYNEGGSISTTFGADLGDGDGGDIKVFGTTVFTILNWMLTWKVLYECGSIIQGNCPPIPCRKDKHEGFWSRMAWTWFGSIILSIGFNFFFLYIYQEIGKASEKTNMSPFVMVTYHMFSLRPSTWMLLLLVPTAAMAVDVIGKIYSNMFYPAQSQIHKEIWKLKSAT